MSPRLRYLPQQWQEPVSRQKEPRPRQPPRSTVTTLRTADGIPIEACHDPVVSVDAPGAVHPRDLAVIVGHGFTGSWRRPALRRVVDMFTNTTGGEPSVGVITLDFRGHGRSGGYCTVGDREVLDIDAAVAWAAELGYRRVATLGFSMGAAIVVRHAALHGPVAAVAAVSGPARWYYRGTPSMRRAHWIVERPAGRLVGRLALGTRIDPAGWTAIPDPPHVAAGRVTPTPLLIVHGDADHYFPVEHGHRLYAAARSPKELWIERGFGHAENAASDDLLGRLRDWLVTAAGTVVPAGPDAAASTDAALQHAVDPAMGG